MMKPTIHWNAKDYSQFLDLRTRPARDLLAVIPPYFQPNIIYDLGCGPGNSTILLKDRWPRAHITGLDSSPEMLDEAKKTYPDIHFIQDDIESFSPVEKIDFICANASLQWVDQHEILIPKLYYKPSKSSFIKREFETIKFRDKRLPKKCQTDQIKLNSRTIFPI